MAEKRTLADRLLDRMDKLGVSPRKAKELTKGLVLTFQRPVKGSLTEKLETRLQRLGLTKIKAHELAKGLAPTVRSVVKAKADARAKKAQKAAKADKALDTSLAKVNEGQAVTDSGEAVISDEDINEAIAQVTDEAEDPELDKVAPRVNGHRLRLDLPVVPMPGGKGLDLLRVMDGWTTRGTYLTAAVKGEFGIVAIRQLGSDLYNVKFYPTMEYWGRTPEELRKLGAEYFLKRSPYERMHCSKKVTAEILDILAKEAAPRSRIKALVSRMRALTFGPLEKAFGYLHSRIAA